MVRRITYPLGWVGCSLQIITNFVIWPTWPCALNPIENHSECWHVKGLICGHKLVWKKQCSMNLLWEKEEVEWTAAFSMDFLSFWFWLEEIIFIIRTFFVCGCPASYLGWNIISEVVIWKNAYDRIWLGWPEKMFGSWSWNTDLTVLGLYVMTSNKIFSHPSLRLCQYIVMNSCLLCYLFIRVDFCQPLLPLAFWLHWAWPHMMERIRIKEWVRKSCLQTLIIVVQ